MNLIKKYLLLIIGAIVGGGAGFAYYYFIGCGTDTCPIRSNPLISILFGAVIGVLVFDLFRKK
ncbi:hypothetical protein D0T49_09105 [Paludibacter sp. 221]|uniref:DUF6132 family protein n=1 Tax=Paludibacter sp. 221 TaxID=2302939 RepID=UPI0013CF6676|nr:DUF6132 family protein [Paludibacter sp. 221]NDV47201.1 hypothetical protein [Paludibacter sp. 221]